jgi:DNA polymerase I
VPFCFDFRDGDVLAWSVADDGATVERDTGYAPTLYAAAPASDREALRAALAGHPAVERVVTETWRTGFRRDPEPVLAVDVRDVDAVMPVARTLRDYGDPGTVRCFGVDFSPEFRYCLETGADPVPGGDLTTLSVDASARELAADRLSEATVDGETVAGDPADVVETVAARVAEADPDVLVVSSGDVVPAFYETARAHDLDLDLGRRPGWDRLAGESTYESYGRVGHSPARYNVPGRVVVDRSNTFFWSQANLEGCLDLVERSHKPLQELSWASIGNVLTAIQIRAARSRGVLVPWNSWRHERFKTMRQLHEADRGGFTFAPAVGLHETVHELDFSSLYPNVIVTRNVSPETVRCDCHADREDVPGLGYAVCDEQGYLPEVLRPLVEDRDDLKAELADCEDPDRERALRGKSSAIKWILVSCFGYQGFSNAKFGRIECHEAINAFAREILLDAKERLEAGGWEVVHGIVDSLWVRAAEDADSDPDPIERVCEQISAAAEIRLEYEGAYDWLAFVPRRSSDAGALTKYFGRRTDGSYRYRGIECRQRSTPAFVAEAQRDLIRTLGDSRDPEAVCDRLQVWLGRLDRGDVPASDLAVRNRVSKRLEAYAADTRNVAALERAARQGLDVSPGEDVEYVVVDDEKRSAERVRLADETGDRYDRSFYRERLLRAAASVLSPLGWRQPRIEAYLRETRDARLTAFVD